MLYLPTDINPDGLDDASKKLDNIKTLANTKITEIVKALKKLRNDQLASAATAVEQQKESISDNNKKAGDAEGTVKKVQDTVKANQMIPGSIKEPLTKALNQSMTLIHNLKAILTKADGLISNVVSDIPKTQQDIGTVVTDLNGLNGKVETLHASGSKVLNGAKKVRDFFQGN